MYSNQENPSNPTQNPPTSEDIEAVSSIGTKELSPTLKNVSIAALVAVLALTGVSSLIVGANTSTASNTDDTEEAASSDIPESPIVGNTQSLNANANSGSDTATASPTTENTAPATNPPSVAVAISDPAKLADLNQQVYTKIDDAWWSLSTSMNADSVFRVRVDERGEIADYEPTNPAAVNNVNKTPLPSLKVANSPVAGDSPTESYADFEVIFKANDSLEVNSR